MYIKEIKIKNFKSFGNSEQTLTLSKEKGELILLSGSNGNGKSSLMNSFDYVLYGKCKGNKKKWATLSTLPNRINGGDLSVQIKFESGGTDVEVIRGISES
jgi:DNA repair exonuclease SbcCD ATPase subunit